MRHRRNHLRTGRRKGILARVRYAFRERQIYLRSEGEVQFVTLKPWVQATTLICLMAGLFWLAFATVNVTFKDQLLALKERRLYQARLDYEDRISAMRASIDRLNNKLLLNQGAYLDKVDGVRADYEKLVERHGRLVEFFRQGWIPVRADDASGRNAGDALRPPQTGTPSGATGGDSSGKGSLNEWSYRQIYARDFTTRSEAERPLTDLRSALGKFEDYQVALLDDVRHRSDRRVKDLSKIFASFGLSAGQIAAKSRYTPDPIGGPFLSLTAADIGSKRIAQRLNASANNLVKAEKLKYEIKRLPLHMPLARYSRITSRYGIRRDPFRRVMAMHAGIDFKAPYGSFILATAPGIVIKAGREGAYGNLVEIRHDNGFTTRYAHMSAIKVKL
ncbi:MAG: M23 family metallopeptidase, partial [Aestuariivirgaceae bacterium]